MQAIAFDQTVRCDANHPEPVPKDGECLVRVHMAGICATDLHIIDGYMGFAGILGHEFVGTVAAGPDEWRGKRVVSEINCVCRKCDMCLSGLATHCVNRTVIGISGRDGCFAELIAVPWRNLHAVPDRITDEQAVFIEPLAAAYQVLAQCKIEPRMNVTVVGAGRLGLLVAQVVKATGCRLTVVDRNRDKLELAEKHGIQSIHVDELIARADRDVVVECSGSAAGLGIAMGLLRPRGTLVLKSTYAQSGAKSNAPASAPSNEDAVPNLAPIVINELHVIGSRCGPFPEAINALTREAVEVRSMISATFPLARGLDALDAAKDPQRVKILITMNPR